MLHGVVPGRRYVVGNGEGSDIRVDGTFASRRHAEVWLENGGWWVADAGSTNGVRVEPAGPLQRGAAAPATVGETPVRLQNGLRIVLSARAEGPASEYPWLALRPAQASAVDGHADRHRQRHAAHAAHRDRRGAGRARPGDADDADPAGGAATRARSA